jgi:BA14K-like protein
MRSKLLICAAASAFAAMLATLAPAAAEYANPAVNSDGYTNDWGYAPDWGYGPDQRYASDPEDYVASPGYGTVPGYAYTPRYDDGTAPVDNDAYCAQRFRSYDPASGTYLGYDGLRHPCP